jgi:hypothetical protein
LNFKKLLKSKQISTAGNYKEVKNKEKIISINKLRLIKSE